MLESLGPAPRIDEGVAEGDQTSKTRLMLYHDHFSRGLMNMNQFTRAQMSF